MDILPHHTPNTMCHLLTKVMPIFKAREEGRGGRGGQEGRRRKEREGGEKRRARGKEREREGEGVVR